MRKIYIVKVNKPIFFPETFIGGAFSKKFIAVQKNETTIYLINCENLVKISLLNLFKKDNWLVIEGSPEKVNEVINYSLFSKELQISETNYNELLDRCTSIVSKRLEYLKEVIRD